MKKYNILNGVRSVIEDFDSRIEDIESSIDYFQEAVNNRIIELKDDNKDLSERDFKELCNNDYRLNSDKNALEMYSAKKTIYLHLTDYVYKKHTEIIK